MKAWRLRELLRNPRQYYQLQIRMCDVAPWIEELVDSPVRHDYKTPGGRAAVLLALLCGMPSRAPQVQAVVLGRWERESAAFWSGRELRRAVR